MKRRVFNFIVFLTVFSLSLIIFQPKLQAEPVQEDTEAASSLKELEILDLEPEVTIEEEKEEPNLDILALAKQHYLTALEYYDAKDYAKAEEEFNKVLWYLNQSQLDIKDHYKLSLLYRSFFKSIKPQVIDQTSSLPAIPSMETDVDIIITPEVKKMIQIYQTKRRKEMSSGLARSTKYLPMIKRIFKEENIPTDLAYMALIESTFRPKIVSRAGAQGMWQFMRATGKIYNLRIDEWLDERNDPEQSTRAAVRYLKSLYEMLGSWRLVMAGYNSGEYRVQRAISKARTRDFWELARQHCLPLETRYYVYGFMAAVVIAKNPEVYGFTDVEYEPELICDKINIPYSIDLNVLARAAGVSYEELKELNPALKNWCTPPDYSAFELNIPAKTKDIFVTALAKIPPQERISWRQHTVKKGETLSVIAQKYNTTIEAIAKASRLRNTNIISIGQELTIPLTPSGYTPTLALVNVEGEESGLRKISYEVRKGDTLNGIARIFSVRLDDIRRWNNMSEARHIYPGEHLTIFTTANN